MDKSNLMPSSETTKSSVSHTTTVRETKGEEKQVPKGAKILFSNIRTETEEIENGFILTKNYDITYEHKGERGYCYYSKKWYSKNNPIKVKVTLPKSLADKFE